MTSSNSKLWVDVHDHSDLDKGIFENSFPSQQLCKFYDHHVIPYSLTTRHHDLNWLEYGCASGNALSFLIQRDSLIKTLYLVDVSYSITKNAFENISGSIDRVMKFKELIPNECKLQLPENSIDIINAESSLYYNDFDDLRGYVNDIYRILRPGGVCRYVQKPTKIDMQEKNGEFQNTLIEFLNPTIGKMV